MNHAPLDGLRILVLEDEFLIALDVEDLCRQHGAADVEIVGTLEALGADPFERRPFDLAVLDLMLGGRPTTGFAGQLRERAIPFVFATGHTDEGLFEGFDGVPVVEKPYSGRALLNAIADAVARVRAL